MLGYEIVNSPEKLKIILKQLSEQIRNNSIVKAKVTLEKGVVKINFDKFVKVRISLRNKIERDKSKIKRFIEISISVYGDSSTIYPYANSNDGLIGEITFIVYANVQFTTFDLLYTHLFLSTNKYSRYADINMSKLNIQQINFFFKKEYDMDTHMVTSKWLTIDVH